MICDDGPDVTQYREILTQTLRPSHGSNPAHRASRSWCETSGGGNREILG